MRKYILSAMPDSYANGIDWNSLKQLRFKTLVTNEYAYLNYHMPKTNFLKPNCHEGMPRPFIYLALWTTVFGWWYILGTRRRDT